MAIITPDAQATLQRARDYAQSQKLRYVFAETVLLALIDDKDASEILKGCKVDLPSLKKDLEDFHARRDDLRLRKKPQQTEMTTEAHRIVQRALIHVQTSGKDSVTGANLLFSAFSERESVGNLLNYHGISRLDAYDFMMHGSPEQQQQEKVDGLLREWIENAFPNDERFTHDNTCALSTDKHLQEEIKALVAKHAERTFNLG